MIISRTIKQNYNITRNAAKCSETFMNLSLLFWGL